MTDQSLKRLPEAHRDQGRRTPKTSTTTTSTSRRSGRTSRKGKGIGRDGMVLTDWMANRLINQVELGAAASTRRSSRTRRTSIPIAAEPDASTRRASTPCRGQSGMTGIAYNIKLTGQGDQDDRRLPRRVRDQDGAHRDARHRRAVHARHGRGPDPADVRRRAARVRRAREGGRATGKIDGFNGNDYVDDLGAGNLAAAFAWSGDVAQITLDNPDVRFVDPRLGRHAVVGQLHDPDRRPTRSTSPTEWINFFYDPHNAAVLTAGDPVQLAGRRASPTS